MNAPFITYKYEQKTTDIKNHYGITMNNGAGGKGKAVLKKGQLVEGTIVSVADKITIAIKDMNVTAEKNILGNVKQGDVLTFEVVKVSDKTVELALYDKADAGRCSFKASIESIRNWDIVKAQKDQEAKKEKKEDECKDVGEKLNDIGTRLTEQDYSRLESEGFPVRDFTVSGLYEALDRIKSEESGKDGINVKKNRESLMNRSNIEAMFKSENIPATNENISKFTKALALSEAASSLDDKAMKYLIMNDLEPTIENIYKAHYSGSKKGHPLSDREWAALVNQASQIITEAGFELTETNLNTARWLVDNQIPLTPKTFSYKKELEKIKVNSGYDAVLDKILESMKAGIDPMNVNLSSGNGLSAKKLVQDIASIRPQAVTRAVRTGTALTIGNLVKIQKSMDELPETDDIAAEHTDADNVSAGGRQYEPDNKAYDINAEQPDYEKRYKEIKALRQLEELRLKMTSEAAVALQKKGIKVDTLELEKVVDALRELENSYYEKLFKEADMEASEQSINLLRETANSIELLKNIPSYVLGSTLSGRFTQTIPQLIEEGGKLQSSLERAGEAYEALMTVPGKEYGDSLQKAFSGIPSLLNELGIENTEQNQRAVRILAYNRMEINEETINQVKAYDMQVNEVIKNLHPAVAVRMIKEGLNPLDIPVYELNRKIDLLRQEQGITSEEKYSTFLRKLEKANGISGAERKAYIGIYRLLYNVEKSDGAAIGAVIKTGRELTLDNLLTAVMTGKKGTLDATVNDEFGLLDGIERDREAIATQLSLFSSEASQKDPKVTDEQIDYFNRIIKRLKDDASPDIFAKTVQEAKSQSEMTDTPSMHLSKESNEIWDLIKDIPVEKLFEQQKNRQDNDGSAQEAYQDAVKNLRQLCKNAEQSIRFLNDYNLPSTPMNLILAGQILSNGESPFKRIIKLQQEKKNGKLDENVKEINNFTDKLVDRQSMEETYSHLEESVKDVLEDMCAREQIGSHTIDRYISLQQQLQFLKKLADKEFYQIPVMTDNGITNVNLTIVRKAQSYGELAVTTSSQKLGNIKAELTLKSNELTGYISCDNREGLDKLKSNIAELDNAARENSVAISKLDYLLIKKDAINNYRESANDDDVPKNPDTERILYSLAKSLLKVVSNAENTEL